MADFRSTKRRSSLSLTDLPQEIIIEIIRRSPGFESIAHLHPVLRQAYQRYVVSELEEIDNWADYELVVDRVLNNYAGGGGFERLSIRMHRYNEEGDEDGVNAAVARWLGQAHRLGVNHLEVVGIRRLGVTTRVNFQPFHQWVDLVELHLSSIHFPHLDAVADATLPNLRHLNLQHITTSHGNNLGTFLNACPNLQHFTLSSCLRNGSFSLRCPSLQTLDISLVLRWIITLRRLPSLTHFRVHSRDLTHLLISRQSSMSRAPIPSSRRLVVSTVQSVSTRVENNLSAVISFLQYFSSLRYLDIVWNASATTDTQFDHVHELASLRTVTVQGLPLFDEPPVRVLVEYILLHSPRLTQLSLVVPRHPHTRVLRDDYLVEIGRMIGGLPRASQQVQFEFSWTEN